MKQQGHSSRFINDLYYNKPWEQEVAGGSRVIGDRNSLTLKGMMRAKEAYGPISIGQ